MKQFLAVMLFGAMIFSAQAAEKTFVQMVEKDLVDAKGRRYKEAKTLREKEFVLVYYSAHWCPPCRQFTPKLVEFYNKNGGGDRFEIVFVSSDRSSKEMEGYMSEASMPWPAVKFKSIKKTGAKKFAGAGIPCLVMFDKEGKVISDSYKGKTYLGPTKVLDDLKAALAK